ncbi:MAG: hypothetical protein R3C25_11370 [Hyphomonadaceae bacterium]
MNRTHLAAFAALLLGAACGQPATTEEAPAAPQSLFDQVMAMGAESQPVFAYQQLIAYQQAHPDVLPVCQHVRGTEHISIPENVAPDSIYAAHQGATVFSVQCGDLISATRMDPREHWLVIFAPGAAEPTVLSCLTGADGDACPRQVPTAAAPATP